MKYKAQFYSARKPAKPSTQDCTHFNKKWMILNTIVGGITYFYLLSLARERWTRTICWPQWGSLSSQMVKVSMCSFYRPSSSPVNSLHKLIMTANGPHDKRRRFQPPRGRRGMTRGLRVLTSQIINILDLLSTNFPTAAKCSLRH